VQRARGLRLAQHARLPLAAPLEPLGQDLDRDLAPEALVDGAVDLPHAAFAEAPNDAVVEEAGGDVAQGFIVPCWSYGMITVCVQPTTTLTLAWAPVPLTSWQALSQSSIFVGEDGLL